MKKKLNDLTGESFCFTGVRRADLELIIIELGGSISKSVSKNTTCLVMKEKGTSTVKEITAIERGIRIIDVEELEQELGF